MPETQANLIENIRKVGGERRNEPTTTFNERQPHDYGTSMWRCNNGGESNRLYARCSIFYVFDQGSLLSAH